MLIESYRNEAPRRDNQDAALLLQAVARLHEEVLDDPVSALGAAQEALALDPACGVALHQALRLVTAAEQPQRAAELLQQAVEHTGSVGHRIALLLQLALLQELRLGQPDQAIQTYQRVRTEDPTNTTATSAILRYQLARADWPQVADLCRELATAEVDPESRCTLLLVAGLLSSATEEPVLGPCLAIQHGALAATLAMAVFGQHTDMAQLVELLQGHTETDTSALLQCQISWLLAQLQRVGDAIPHARRSTELAPRELVTWSWLATLLRQETRWDELVQVLRQIGALTEEQDSVAARIAHHMTVALVLEERLRQPDQAITELEAVLTLDPTHTLAGQWLAALYTREERWPELLEMHVNRGEWVDTPAARADALYDAACVLHHHLGRTDQAILSLERAIDESERHTPANWMLESLYRTKGMWSELVALLSLQVKHVESSPLRASTGALHSALQGGSPTARASLLLEIATLQEHRLSDRQAALRTHRELQQLAAVTPHTARTLIWLCESVEDTASLLAILRQQEAQLELPGERAMLLVRAGQILEHTDPAAALAQYRRAQELAPDVVVGLRSVVLRTLVQLQRWPELVQELEAQLQDVDVPEERFDLLCRMGWLQEHHIGRPAATASYLAALATGGQGLPRDLPLLGLLRTLDPSSDGVALLPGQLDLLGPDWRSGRASASLQQLALQLTNDAQPLGTELLARATRLDPPSQLAALLLLQSQAHQGDWESVIAAVPPLYGGLVALGGLKQRERAMQLFRDHSTLSPGCLASARWLELLAATHGRKTLEVEALGLLIRGEHGVVRRVEALHRLALQAELGQEGADPLQHYQAILELQPRDERALLALERLARQRADSPLLLRALQGLSELAPPREQAALLTTRACLLVQLERPDEAIPLLHHALELWPSHRPAYDTLKGLYIEGGDAAGLSWVLECGLDSVTHPRMLTTDLLRRATFREERGDLDAALADLDRVLDIDPGHPEALDATVHLLRRRGTMEPLVQRLECGARHTTSPRRQARVLLLLGQLYRDQFGELARAQETLARAIALDPDNVEALLQNAELHLRLEQPTEALAMLNRVVLHTDNEDEQVQAQLQMANISDMLGDPIRARASLEAVLALRPDHPAALALAARLAREQGETALLERLLRRQVELVDDDERRAGVLYQLSQLLRKRHGDSSTEGLEPLEQAIALQPTNAAWLRELVGALENSGRWSELELLLERRIGALEPAQQIPFLLTHGRVLGIHLGRQVEARAVLHQVLQGDPENRMAMELLLEQLDGITTHDLDLLDEAIGLHRRLLGRNPLTVASIRAIHQLCKLAGRVDESFCAGGCLVMLGEATQEEQYFHAQLRRRATIQPTGQLKDDALAALTLPAGDHPLRQLLLLLRDHLPQLLPPDLGHYGLQATRETRLAANHPAWDVASLCSGVLRLGHFDLGEARGGAPHGTCLPGNPPLLLLPRNVLRLPMPDQLFLFGRLLARVSTGTEALEPGRRDPVRIRELDLLVAALLDTGEAPSTVVLDLRRHLEQLDPSDLDRARQLATLASSPESRANWTSWIHSTEVGACRTGLLCCGGLDGLALFWTGPGGPISDDILRELLLFSLGQPYTELRARLGLQLQE